ncbi:MAG: hypothetical protein GY892_18190, partial [Shimia sp.]|nr:hypothetical protein [Shimia sp.]
GSLDEAGIKARALSDPSTPGDDTVYGTIQNDIITDGVGNDTIYGQNGDDTIIYASGNDVIENGNTGSDTLDLSQYAAADVSFRVVGHDVFITTPDGEIELDYQVRYEIGNAKSNIETILFSDGSLDETGIKARALSDPSTPGDDIITGTIQADLIIVGAGDDTITGGNGADVFEFNIGGERDTIIDFDVTAEIVRFIGTSLSFGDLKIADNGSDTTVTYGAGDVITLAGIDAIELTDDHFQFV